MARRPQIDREELRRLAGEGWAEADLAVHFGVSVSGVRQAKRAAGLTRKQLDHSRAIPWTVGPEHVQSGPATNLRTLSSIIQGVNVPEVKRNTAVRWARGLIEKGQDVAYDRDAGFHTVTAGDRSHVQDLLESIDMP